jgi:hypothetical protein
MSLVRDEMKLKTWECVQVNHHKHIGEMIGKWEKGGWQLHTYSCANYRGSEINHYLLFKREI